MNSDQSIRRHSVGHRIALRTGVRATDQTTRLTVHAGSEIVLNGENSDGTRFPLANATWTQIKFSRLLDSPIHSAIK